MEALRCLKRRLSDAVYRQLVADAQAAGPMSKRQVREGTRGRLHNPARPTYPPRSSALRTSHSPDPHDRRYPSQDPVAPPRGLDSQPAASTRRSRQDGAPHRTNDLDGDKRRRTLKGAETAHLTQRGPDECGSSRPRRRG